MTAPRCAIALMAGLALAAAAPAADVRGVVTGIDPDKKELIVDTRGPLGRRGAVLVFALPDQPSVMFGDQPGALVDVEVGRRVRVQYETADGRPVVQVIVVLGGARPAVALPQPSPSGGEGRVRGAPATPAVPADGDAVTGVLRHVGYSDRELVVIGPGAKGPETETTVAVPEAARIVKDGKDATLDDLKEGDSAAVQVESKDGRPSAVSVQVGPGVAPVAEKKPPGRVISRLRVLLKAADQVLQGMENRDREP